MWDCYVVGEKHSFCSASTLPLQPKLKTEKGIGKGQKTDSRRIEKGRMNDSSKGKKNLSFVLLSILFYPLSIFLPSVFYPFAISSSSYAFSVFSSSNVEV